jgi:hypothetical protein
VDQKRSGLTASTIDIATTYENNDVRIEGESWVKNGGRQCAKVLRTTLRTGADFETYVARMGRPKFAVNLGDEEADENGPFVRLSADEWLFVMILVN